MKVEDSDKKMLKDLEVISTLINACVTTSSKLHLHVVQ